MSVTNAAIAAMLAKAKQRNEEVKKEGYKDIFYRPKNVSDGETIELKMLLSSEGQPLFAEVLSIETGEQSSFRSTLSQNFPFETDGHCTFVEALEAANSDPDARAAHATVLSKVKRLKRLVYPVLVLKVETDSATGEVTKYSILDNEVKFFEVTPNQSTDLLGVIDSRGAKNPDGGVYSFTKGKTVSLTRTGRGMKDTKYAFALGEAIELSAEDTKKFNQPVDTEAYIKSHIPSDEKMNEVIVKLFA